MHKFIFSCIFFNLMSLNILSAQYDDNPIITKLIEESNIDKYNNSDLSDHIKNDSLRELKILELIKLNNLNTSNDYYNAGILLMKGRNEKSPSLAVELISKATNMDMSKDKFLLANAIDRELLSQNKPQIYGTEFYKNYNDGKWSFYPIDSSTINDLERKNYNVDPLEVQRLKIKNLNLPSIVTLIEQGKNIDLIIEIINKENLNTNQRTYNISEEEINNLGYVLVNAGDHLNALKIFELNTRLYPKAYNTWDSLGECYLSLNIKNKAEEAYLKSIALNKYNFNAKNVVNKIKGH